MTAQPATRGGRITGWGIAVPDKIVTNADLEKDLDTNDAWIRERTGIHERRVGSSTRDLGVEAARNALKSAGVEAEEIDVLLLATTSQDRQMPATANMIQSAIGATNAGACDVNAACSGFVYAVTMANGLLATGAQKVLVVGAETLSRFTDWNDRNTAILFGDGAGAVVMEATDGPGNVLGWSLGSMGELEHLFYCDLDGGKMSMNGKEVFRQAVKVMASSSAEAIERAGVTMDDIKLVVPHQANARIIEAACRRMKIPIERTAQVLHKYGNTSSASIPLALVDAIDDDRLESGDLVLLVGFGAGMTSAAAVVRWEP